jgi:hypothetical protein
MTGERKIYAQADATIGSAVVKGAHEIQEAMSDIAQDGERFAMLSKLVYGALKGAPDNLSVFDILMMSDIVAGWAIAQMARASNETVESVQQQWVLANAIRARLFPVPTLADVASAVEASRGEPN